MIRITNENKMILNKLLDDEMIFNKYVHDQKINNGTD